MLTNQERCDIILASLFPDQPLLIEKWWTSPNKAFDLSTPSRMFEQDESRVVKYLYGQLNSDYS